MQCTRLLHCKFASAIVRAQIQKKKKKTFQWLECIEEEREPGPGGLHSKKERNQLRYLLNWTAPLFVSSENENIYSVFFFLV